MKNVARLLLLSILLTVNTGCYRNYTTKLVKESETIPMGYPQQKVFNTVTTVLLDQGFDIKMSDKDIGLITTEFKQYGTFGDKPPFDYFLQLRIRISEVGGKYAIKFVPVVKSINRLNVGAFQESELFFMFENPGLPPMQYAEFYKGTILYNNVLQLVAEYLKIDFNTAITHKFTQTQVTSDIMGRF